MAILSMLLVGACTYDNTLTVSGNGSFFFDYFNSYLYVTDEGASSNSVFKIYDMSDPSGPVLKSTTSLPNGSGAVHPKAHSLSGYGTVLLIPYRTSKVLAIWDVNTPTAPTLLGSTSMAFAPNSVAAIGTLACVGFNESFLQTSSAQEVDISNPASPLVVASWSASKLVLEVRKSTDHFFLSGQNASAGNTHVTAIRASDFTVRDSQAGGSAAAGIGSGALKINAAATIAFNLNLGNSAICSWDISDVTNITLTQQAAILGVTPGGGCLAINETTSRAYAGLGTAGLTIRIIDISNPASMTATGNISTSSESVTDIAILDDGCAGLAWGQGTGAAIHLLGTPPLA